MKVQKGDAGYIRAQKTKLIIETILAFAIVAGFVIAGYIINHTKLNMLTLVAVLACLPACKILLGLIMIFPHRSLSEVTELEIAGVSEHLTVAYDLVVTSERKAMPIDAVVIRGNTVCGYTSSPKVDAAYTARHIKSILRQNKFDNITVKLFHDYVAFISRAEGMDNMAAVEKSRDRQMEEAIREIILDISL